VRRFISEEVAGGNRGSPPIPWNKGNVRREPMSSHEIAQFRKIAKTIAGSQQGIINDQASAKFLWPPDDVSEDKSAEHNERHDGAEMIFDVIEARAYRLVDVNHSRACTEKNRDAPVLEPKEHRCPSGRDDTGGLRFSTRRCTNQEGVFVS
jgi:hypothetical protein